MSFDEEELNAEEYFEGLQEYYKQEGAREMSHREEILKLKEGERYFWPESDYGKAEIHFSCGIYILFEIPMFGGEPMFAKVFPSSGIDDLIKTVEGWT
jgi:hypothetical protein